MSGPRRSKPEPYKPPAEFGQRVVELLKTITPNKTAEELVHAVGYESKKTLDRLARGEGSLEFALVIRDQLEAWGANVTDLRLAVDRGGPLLEDWEREWLGVGRQLRRLLPEDDFATEVKHLRGLVDKQMRNIAEGTGSIPTRRR